MVTDFMWQSPTAGTAYITFDNVKVPVENTLGREGGGISVMLSYILILNATSHAPGAYL
jgi:alkylation response protein AidB-like acyl-CoA dehydrogenase